MLAEEFRKVVGTFATGVTVITTQDAQGEPNGFTANAFASLSLDPPLVIVCIDRRSETYDAMHREDAAIAVNVLAEHQEGIARRFASKGGAQKFTDLPCYDGETGVPVFDDLLAYIECEVTECLDGGDHKIIVGRVLNLEAREGVRPLVFHEGRFGTFKPHKAQTSAQPIDLMSDVTRYFGDLEGAAL